MNALSDSFILNNGVKIPCMGFGTWQTPDGDVAVSSVKTAVEAGYRHIDTAAIYKNEDGVGEGIRQSGIDREALFVTTKLWNSERGYDKTLKAFDASLKKLGLDHVDLYLIHWPANEKQFGRNADGLNAETWKAMEAIYASGRAKAVGVSNFLKHHLEKLFQTVTIMPAADQIEFHPGYTQTETVDFCRANGILVEGYSPLGTGNVLKNETVRVIAAKYGVSAARLCVRYALQSGVLPLPKSVTPERIRENAIVFDFEISDGDMRTIGAIQDLGRTGSHPDEVPW